MSSLPYLSIVRDVAKVGMVLTLITNSSLIYITIYHIKNIKGPYKSLVLLLAALGMVFAVMEIFIQPFMHSFNASFVFFSIAPIFGAPKAVRAGLVLFYSQVYLLIICVIALQFVYRYFIITNSKFIGFFTGWRVFWWILYLLVCTVVWACSACLCLPDTFAISYLKEELMTQYGENSTEVPGFFIVAYEHLGSKRTFRVNSIICIFGLSSTLITQYIIIIFCGFKIHLKIRDTMEATSCKKYRIQSQLFKTLVLQITAPSLFYHVPALLMYFIPYFDLEISVPSGVMVCFFSVYPAIDTVILVWMVTEYQVVIGNMIENRLVAVLEWLRSLTLGIAEDQPTGTA